MMLPTHANSIQGLDELTFYISGVSAHKKEHHLKRSNSRASYWEVRNAGYNNTTNLPLVVYRFKKEKCWLHTNPVRPIYTCRKSVIKQKDHSAQN